MCAAAVTDGRCAGGRAAPAPCPLIAPPTQIERYACLYTSHVSNLAFVAPDKSFMGRVDVMAHEWDDGQQTQAQQGAPAAAAAAASQAQSASQQ